MLQAIGVTEAERFATWIEIICELFHCCGTFTILIPNAWMNEKQQFKEYFLLEDVEAEQKGTDMVLLGEIWEWMDGKRGLEKPRDVMSHDMFLAHYIYCGCPDT